MICNNNVAFQTHPIFWKVQFNRVWAQIDMVT